MNIIPNPVKSESSIQYFIDSNSHVNVSICKTNGQLISILVNKYHQKGEHKVLFKNTDLPAGVYFCILKTNDKILIKKLVKL